MSSIRHRCDSSMFKHKRAINLPLRWNVLSTLIFWEVFPLQSISYSCYNVLYWWPKPHRSLQMFLFWKKPTGIMRWFPFIHFKFRDSRKLWLFDLTSCRVRATEFHHAIDLEKILLRAIKLWEPCFYKNLLAWPLMPLKRGENQTSSWLFYPQLQTLGVLPSADC